MRAEATRHPKGSSKGTSAQDKPRLRELPCNIVRDYVLPPPRACSQKLRAIEAMDGDMAQ